MKRHLPDDLASNMPEFKAGETIATRNASGTILQVLSKILPNLVGGSADLAPSTKTIMKDCKDIKAGNFSGRNIHFGVREHGMGSILNGLSLHGGIIPYGATFLVFSDYMRPSLRLAAMMKQPVIFIFTHDSIFVGEDGPTHQPIEQITALRAIPGMTVIRPADAAETAIAWQIALENREGPTSLILTRQKLPVLDRKKLLGTAEGLQWGAYILAGNEKEKPDVLIIASGSEVHIALEAYISLLSKGIKPRLVNMASWELFDKQPAEYREKIIPPEIKVRLSIEAGITMGWCKYTGDCGQILGRDDFGVSAPYKKLAGEFGFTAKSIVEKILCMIDGKKTQC
jgi:transketolase